MTRIQMFGSLAALALFVLSPATAPAATVFWDNFETDVVGPDNPFIDHAGGDVGGEWITYEGDYSPNLCTMHDNSGAFPVGFPFSDGNSFRLRETTALIGTGWDPAITENQVVRVSYRAYNALYTPNPEFTHIVACSFNDDADPLNWREALDRPMFSIHFENDDVVAYTDSDGTTSTMTAIPDAKWKTGLYPPEGGWDFVTDYWADVVMDIDLAAKTFSIAVDTPYYGHTVATGLPWTQDIHRISNVVFSPTASSHSFSMDNVRVEVISGAASVLLQDNFETDVVGNNNPFIDPAGGDVGGKWITDGEYSPAPNNCTMQTTPAGAEGNAWRMRERSASIAQGWDPEITKDETVRLSFRVNANSTHVVACSFNDEANTDDWYAALDRPMFSIYLEENGEVRYKDYDGEFVWFEDIPGLTWAFNPDDGTDCWADVSVEMDLATKTFSISIDTPQYGHTEATGLTWTQNIDRIRNVVFTPQDSAHSFSIDNVRFEVLSLLVGDANRDGVVDDKDASILGANWMQSGTWADGDFNSDGVVNDKDAAILAAHWGEVGEEGSVPEPSVFVSLLGLLLGAVLVLRQRWAA